MQADSVTPGANTAPRASVKVAHGDENIYRNALQNELAAYCLALSDRTGSDQLYLTEFAPGGAEATFRDPRVKSALIELNTSLDEHREVVDHMLEQGFGYDSQEADRARRTEGPFTGTGNDVFRR